MSYLNKTKIDNLLKKSECAIIQDEDDKYYISDKYCIWIDHNAEFFGEDKYISKKQEVPEKDRESIKELMNHLLDSYLHKYDYSNVETETKCKLVSNSRVVKKCVLLKTEDWHKLIEEKYYNTFKKGCKFLISKENWLVFVTDKDGLLIGVISSIFENDWHIEI